MVKAQEVTGRDIRKELLTDKRLGKLSAKPEAAGIIYDVAVPGFGVRVSDKGLLTFILVARFQRDGNPTRRRLGRYPALSLGDARKKAIAWLELIEKGIDPEAEASRRQVEIEKAKKAEQLKQQNSLRSRIVEFLDQGIVKEQRQFAETKRILQKEIADPWGDKLLHEVTRTDVKDRIKEIIERGSPAMARNVLAAAKVFFEWAQDGEYIEDSPAAGISSKKQIGEKPFRDRVLQDDELAAVWRATGIMGYPYGPMYRLLLLTGARLNEIAGARWREVDLEETKILTVPPERFKSKATHIVPLSAQAIAILDTLPRFTKDEDHYIFTLKSGKAPVHSFSVAKERLDKLVADQLGKVPPPFVTHDLRRTVRTRLSALKVPEIVAELVIGHGKKGLARIYNQHKFKDEMREALELWASKLRDITEPPPKNVTKFKKRA
jgi:integrase